MNVSNRVSPKPVSRFTRLTPEAAPDLSVAAALTALLQSLGVRQAFGIPGGAMASIWGALSTSGIEVHNYRHEGGAAFAATEAHFASGHPTVVFTTSGPGITNAVTGMFAARDEGAKVILVSACTSALQRGRGGIQETSPYTLPTAGLFASGELFHYATILEDPAQLAQVHQRLAVGLQRPGGFVAHVSIPTAVQSATLPLPAFAAPRVSLPGVDPETVHAIAQQLAAEPFNIWVGFGARGAAREIVRLAELSGASVMCSPRGKGIFPESHPQFIGVTGLGGHGSVFRALETRPPVRTLVLGTRLGEPTSFWNAALAPTGGFVHVDVAENVFGAAYPDVPTLGVQADIRGFLHALLLQDVWNDVPAAAPLYPRPESMLVDCDRDAPATSVRPEMLMAAIQRKVVAGSEAIVLAECGNSFTWATHLLRFDTPGRYRVSTGVGAMGHGVTGVVGAASARKGKAVVITGDGAMLMNNEVNTAVKYGLPAVWIVLNDARYNMCHQGMKALGMSGADASLPEVDFAAMASSLGAQGLRIRHEHELDAALEMAMKSSQPFVLDVVIDPERLAPSKGRNAGLADQTRSQAAAPPRSFPNN